MAVDGWLSEPNGDGWYWIEGIVAAGPKYIQRHADLWMYRVAWSRNDLRGRRVYPVMDVPKEPKQEEVRQIKGG
jgi:hypothetical protein